jgi:oligopeptidase B
MPKPPAKLDCLHAPARAPKIPHTATIHGETVTDNWFYLRDRQHPATIPYLEAENQVYRHGSWPRWRNWRQRFTTEMVGSRFRRRTRPFRPEKALSSITRARSRASNMASIAARHWPRIRPKKSFSIATRSPKATSYFSLAYDISQPGRHSARLCHRYRWVRSLYPAVQGSHHGAKRCPTKSRTSTIPAPGPTTNFFYTTLDETKRPYRLWRHQIGSGQPDRSFTKKPTRRFNISVERARSGNSCCSRSTATPPAKPAISTTRQPGWPVPDTAPARAGRRILRRTSGRILLDSHRRRTPSTSGSCARRMTTPRPGTEVLPHREDVSIEGLEGFRDHLVIIERANGLKQFRS